MKSNRSPKIVAHRGASFDAPENTLAAFHLGWSQGADAIEGDFHLTRDGHVVCCHDDSMKRTAGVDRKIAELTLDEIRELDVGKWKHERFAGERVPTLAEVLQIVPAEKYALLEIKSGPETVPAVKLEVERSQVACEQIRIIAFNADVIAAAKQAMPQVAAYWLTEWKDDHGVKRPTLEEVLTTLKRVGADGLDAHGDPAVVDEVFLAKVREAGYELHLWTIDNPDHARRFAQLGVDSLTTNKPRLIREAIATCSTIISKPA